MLVSLGCSTTDDRPLNAAAGFQEGRVFVQNKSADPWLEVRIEVNGAFVHVSDIIPPGETYRFLPAIFTKSDGTRLDPSLVTIQRIDIHATTPTGRAHWNGSY